MFLKTTARKNLFKLISVCTVVCFCANQVWAAFPQNSAPAGSHVQTISVPASLGTIQDSFFPSAHPPAAWKGRLLIHIQDAHGVPEAQKSIESLLDYLQTHYGLDRIYLEGAVGDLDTSRFHFSDSWAQNEKIWQKLFEESVLSGSELYLLKHRRGKDAQGVEDEAPYAENLRLFKAVMAEAHASELMTQALCDRLDLAATRILSPGSRELFRAWWHYEDKHEGLMDFLKTLLKNPGALKALETSPWKYQARWPSLTRLIALKNLEGHLDPERIRLEKETFLNLLRTRKVDPALISAFEKKAGQENISREGESARSLFEKIFEALGNQEKIPFAGFPNFIKWARYQILSEEINAVNLAEETERFAREIAAAQLETAEQKDVLKSFESLLLLKKVMKLELSRKDWEKVLEQKEKIRPGHVAGNFNQLLAGKRGVAQFSLQDFKASDSVFENAVEFYKIAVRRDSVLMNRALRDMEKMQTQKSVLITGGFHGEGIKALLRKKGVAYVQISPTLRGEISSRAYVERMMRSAGPSAKSGFSNVAIPVAVQKRDVLRRLGEWDYIAGRVEEAKQAASLGQSVDFLFDPQVPDSQILDFLKNAEFGQPFDAGSKQMVFPDKQKRFVLKAMKMVSSDIQDEDLESILANPLKRVLYNWIRSMLTGYLGYWLKEQMKSRLVKWGWLSPRHQPQVENGYGIVAKLFPDHPIRFRQISLPDTFDFRGFTFKVRLFAQRDTAWIIQDYVPEEWFVGQRVKQAVESGDMDKAESIVRDSIDFTISLWSKGVFDTDAGINIPENLILTDSGTFDNVDWGAVTDDENRIRAFLEKKRAQLAEIHAYRGEYDSLRQMFEALSRPIPQNNLASVAVRFYGLVPEPAADRLAEVFLEEVRQKYTVENWERVKEQAVEGASLGGKQKDGELPARETAELRARLAYDIHTPAKSRLEHELGVWVFIFRGLDLQIKIFSGEDQIAETNQEESFVAMGAVKGAPLRIEVGGRMESNALETVARWVRTFLEDEDYGSYQGNEQLEEEAFDELSGVAEELGLDVEGASLGQETPIQHLKFQDAGIHLESRLDSVTTVKPGESLTVRIRVPVGLRDKIQIPKVLTDLPGQNDKAFTPEARDADGFDVWAVTLEASQTGGYFYMPYVDMATDQKIERFWAGDQVYTPSIRILPQWATDGMNTAILFVKTLRRPGTDQTRFGTFTDLKWYLKDLKFNENPAKRIQLDAALLLPFTDSFGDSPYEAISPYAIHPKHVDWDEVTYPGAQTAEGQPLKTKEEKFKWFKEHRASQDAEFQDFLNSDLYEKIWEYADVKSIFALRGPNDGPAQDAAIRAKPEYHELAGSKGNHQDFGYYIYEQYIAHKQVKEAVKYVYEELGIRMGFDIPFFPSDRGALAFHHPADFVWEEIQGGDGQMLKRIKAPRYDKGHPAHAQTWYGQGMWDYEELRKADYEPVLAPFRFWRDLGFRIARWDAAHMGPHDLHKAMNEQDIKGQDFLLIPEQLGGTTSGVDNDRESLLKNGGLLYHNPEYDAEAGYEGLVGTTVWHRDDYYFRVSSTHDSPRMPWVFRNVVGPSSTLAEEQIKMTAMHRQLALSQEGYTFVQGDEWAHGGFKKDDMRINIPLTADELAKGRKEWHWDLPSPTDPSAQRYDLREAIAKFIRIRQEHAVLHQPKTLHYLWNTAWGKVSSFVRLSSSEAVLVINNLSNEQQRGELVFTDKQEDLLSMQKLGIPIDRPFAITNLETGQEIQLSQQNNRIHFELEPGQAYVFDLKQIRVAAQSLGELEKSLVLSIPDFISFDALGKPAMYAGGRNTHFGDQEWGRDFAISMTGLNEMARNGESIDFPEGRKPAQEIAKDLIRRWAGIDPEGRAGMDPNDRRRINPLHSSGDIMYNVINWYGDFNRSTVDAPLWFVEAVFGYIDATQDTDFLNEVTRDNQTLLDVLWAIVDRYGMTGEELSRAGINPHSIQRDAKTGFILVPRKKYTWMDTEFTERQGYPVEIQALWFNALNRIADLTGKIKPSETEKIAKARGLAAQVEINFPKYFWNEETQHLYDLLGTDGLMTADQSVEKGWRDSSNKPNQLFAVYFGLLKGDKAVRVMKAIERELLIPGALRSLSPKAPHYRHDFEVAERQGLNKNAAYHSGLGWVWLYPFYYMAAVDMNLIMPADAERQINADLEPIVKNSPRRSLPELLSGDAYGGIHARRGPDVQSWSVMAAIAALRKIKARQAQPPVQAQSLGTGSFLKKGRVSLPAWKTILDETALRTERELSAWAKSGYKVTAFPVGSSLYLMDDKGVVPWDVFGDFDVFITVQRSQTGQVKTQPRDLERNARDFFAMHLEQVLAAGIPGTEISEGGFPDEYVMTVAGQEKPVNFFIHLQEENIVSNQAYHLYEAMRRVLNLSAAQPGRDYKRALKDYLYFENYMAAMIPSNSSIYPDVKKLFLANPGKASDFYQGFVDQVIQSGRINEIRDYLDTHHAELFHFLTSAKAPKFPEQAYADWVNDVSHYIEQRLAIVELSLKGSSLGTPENYFLEKVLKTNLSALRFDANAFSDRAFPITAANRPALENVFRDKNLVDRETTYRVFFRGNNPFALALDGARLYTPLVPTENGYFASSHLDPQHEKFKLAVSGYDQVRHVYNNGRGMKQKQVVFSRNGQVLVNELVTAFPGVYHPWHDDSSQAMIEAMTDEIKPGMEIYIGGLGSGFDARYAARLGASVRGVDVNEGAIPNVFYNFETDPEAAVLLPRLVKISRNELFADLTQGEDQFDLIFFNLPSNDTRPEVIYDYSFRDPGRNILDSLLVNAVKYLKPGGKLVFVHGEPRVVRQETQKFGITARESQASNGYAIFKVPVEAYLAASLGSEEGGLTGAYTSDLNARQKLDRALAIKYGAEIDDIDGNLTQPGTPEVAEQVVNKIRGSIRAGVPRGFASGRAEKTTAELRLLGVHDIEEVAERVRQGLSHDEISRFVIFPENGSYAVWYEWDDLAGSAVRKEVDLAKHFGVVPQDFEFTESDRRELYGEISKLFEGQYENPFTLREDKRYGFAAWAQQSGLPPAEVSSRASEMARRIQEFLDRHPNPKFRMFEALGTSVSVDLMVRGVNKALAIKFMAEKFGLKEEEVAATDDKAAKNGNGWAWTNRLGGFATDEYDPESADQVPLKLAIGVRGVEAWFFLQQRLQWKQTAGASLGQTTPDDAVKQAVAKISGLSISGKDGRPYVLKTQWLSFSHFEIAVHFVEQGNLSVLPVSRAEFIVDIDTGGGINLRSAFKTDAPAHRGNGLTSKMLGALAEALDAEATVYSDILDATTLLQLNRLLPLDFHSPVAAILGKFKARLDSREAITLRDLGAADEDLLIRNLYNAYTQGAALNSRQIETTLVGSIRGHFAHVHELIFDYEDGMRRTVQIWTHKAAKADKVQLAAQQAAQASDSTSAPAQGASLGMGTLFRQGLYLAAARLGNYDFVANGLSAADAEVRRTVRTLIDQANDPELKIDGYIRALRYSDSEAVIEAIKALEELQATRALDALMEKFYAYDFHVRKALVQAIGTLGDQDTVAKLSALIQEKSYLPYVVITAAHALAHLGKKQEYKAEAVKILIELSSSQKERFFRQTAAELLGNLGDRSAIEPVKKLLGDASESVRDEAQKALGKLGVPPGEVIKWADAAKPKKPEKSAGTHFFEYVGRSLSPKLSNGPLENRVENGVLRVFRPRDPSDWAGEGADEIKNIPGGYPYVRFYARAQVPVSFKIKLYGIEKTVRVQSKDWVPVEIEIDPGKTLEYFAISEVSMISDKDSPAANAPLFELKDIQLSNEPLSAQAVAAQSLGASFEQAILKAFQGLDGSVMVGKRNGKKYTVHVDIKQQDESLYFSGVVVRNPVVINVEFYREYESSDPAGYSFFALDSSRPGALFSDVMTIDQKADRLQGLQSQLLERLRDTLPEGTALHGNIANGTSLVQLNSLLPYALKRRPKVKTIINAYLPRVEHGEELGMHALSKEERMTLTENLYRAYQKGFAFTQEDILSSLMGTLLTHFGHDQRLEPDLSQEEGELYAIKHVIVKDKIPAQSLGSEELQKAMIERVVQKELERVEGKIIIACVCSRNVQRSPTVEILFEKILRDKNMTGQFAVMSAGLNQTRVGPMPETVFSRAVSYGVAPAVVEEIRKRSSVKPLDRQFVEAAHLILVAEEKMRREILTRFADVPEIENKIVTFSELEESRGDLPDTIDFALVDRILQVNFSALLARAVKNSQASSLGEERFPAGETTTGEIAGRLRDILGRDLPDLNGRVRARMLRVLEELIKNVIEHGFRGRKEPGDVVLTTDYRQGESEFVISDRGKRFNQVRAMLRRLEAPEPDFESMSPEEIEAYFNQMQESRVAQGEREGGFGFKILTGMVNTPQDPDRGIEIRYNRPKGHNQLTVRFNHSAIEQAIARSEETTQAQALGEMPIELPPLLQKALPQLNGGVSVQAEVLTVIYVAGGFVRPYAGPIASFFARSLEPILDLLENRSNRPVSVDPAIAAANENISWILNRPYFIQRGVKPVPSAQTVRNVALFLDMEVLSQSTPGQIKHLADNLKRGDLVMAFWNGEGKGAGNRQKPKALSDLIKQLGPKGIRVTDILSERPTREEIKRGIPSHLDQGILVSNVKGAYGDLQVSVETDRFRFNMEKLLQARMDPNQVVALLRQIAEVTDKNKRFELYSAVLGEESFNAATNSWLVGSNLINFIKRLSTEDAATKSLARAA